MYTTGMEVPMETRRGGWIPWNWDFRCPMNHLIWGPGIWSSKCS